MKMTRKI
jgi:hypothetical protein